MRIGVVADSHVGEYLPRMPSEVLEVLDGCDLVLHAGDLSVASVVDDLAAVAPVVAVRGDHDRLGGLALPPTAVVSAAGHRIGLVHGERPVPDVLVTAAHVLAGRRLEFRGGLHAALARRLGPVDCVVYGHWHEPLVARHGGTLMFNPGAVCPWGSVKGGRPEQRGLAAISERGVHRYRLQLGPEAMTPTIGIIEVGSGGIRPRHVRLRRPVG